MEVDITGDKKGNCFDVCRKVELLVYVKKCQAKIFKRSLSFFALKITDLQQYNITIPPRFIF